MKDGFAWYEEKRRGLGDEFLDEVAGLFRNIGQRPSSFPVVELPFRRALLHRFPYAIYFIAEGLLCEVFAVLHQRRDPAMTQQRLRRR